MARFDVFRLGDGLVVDVQTDYLPGILSRLVIPLKRPEVAPRRTLRLNPVFQIAGERFVLVPQQMSSVSTRLLTQRVGSLSSERDDIMDAIDVLLTGF